MTENIETDSALATDENWFGDEAATFGDRLTAGREAIGLTPEDLAQRLGVTERTLTAWEQDMSGPRANRLQMLAAVLNVSLRWLVTGEGEPPSELRAVSSEDAGAILEELRALRNEAERTSARLQALETRLSDAVGKDA